MDYSILTRKPKKKKNHLIADWFLYVFLRIVIAFLFLFKVETSLAFARFLGRLLWKHYHRGRQRALDNLRASFPEKSEEWLCQTGRRSLEHFAMLGVDLLFTPRLVSKHNWRDYARYHNVERTKWLMQEKKGLIMVTGHYGNFEILGYILGLSGFDIYTVARPLDSTFISRYIYGIRERAGQRMINKRGAVEAMTAISERGGTICFIPDQDAGRKGIFVYFFGRKASTFKSIGLLAITYNLPIVVGYSKRVDNRFFFDIGVTRIIMPQEWADKDDPLTWITAEYTKAIEDFVRQDPTQYWWLHRRWKTRPKEELARQDTCDHAPIPVTGSSNPQTNAQAIHIQG